LELNADIPAVFRKLAPESRRTAEGLCLPQIKPWHIDGAVRAEADDRECVWSAFSLNA